MSNRPPIVINPPDPIYDDREEPATRTVNAYDPSYILITRNTDHAGSGREDGWAMRIDLSDGATLFVQFSRRKIWQSEAAEYLGVCGGVHAWATRQEKR